MNFQPFQLRKINLLLGILTAALLLLLVTLFCLSSTRGAIEVPPPEKVTLSSVPKSFQMDDEAYIAINDAWLTLQSQSLEQKLPDLRPLLISYGITCRPDCEASDSKILIGMRGQREHEAVKLNERLYLRYDARSHLARWQISPNNAPTPIWIELEKNDTSIVASLRMKNVKGEFIKEPYEASYFVLPEMPQPISQEVISKWRIGSLNVDTSILARQRAEWHGQDIFLQMHGGEEFAFSKDSERINFDEDGKSYSVFVRAGDMLVYDDAGWHTPLNKEDSKGKSLLYVKKIADGAIAFDLWENEGKMKLPLELRRIVLPEYRPAPLDIKLVGARSKRDWIAQIGGKRELLRADDWLLIAQGQYSRLTKPEELDDYLHGITKGELVALDGVKRVDNEMCLTGMQFNEARTQCSAVAIPLYKHDTPPSIIKNEARAEDDDEDDFDDDDEDDDENSHSKKKGHRSDPRSSLIEDDDDDFDDEDEDNDDFV